MRYLLFLPLALLCFSCNSFITEEHTTDSVIQAKAAQSASEKIMPRVDTMCYEHISGDDIYTYRLVRDSNLVAGTAVYDHFEKDDSRGAVKGVITGDIMHLWYEFHSEGVNSVSEKYFKISADGITEGIGAFNVRGDTSYFTDTAAINYNGGLVYKRINCN